MQLLETLARRREELVDEDSVVIGALVETASDPPRLTQPLIVRGTDDSFRRSTSNCEPSLIVKSPRNSFLQNITRNWGQQQTRSESNGNWKRWKRKERVPPMIIEEFLDKERVDEELKEVLPSMFREADEVIFKLPLSVKFWRTNTPFRVTEMMAIRKMRCNRKGREGYHYQRRG